MSEITTANPIKTYITSAAMPRITFYLDIGQTLFIDRIYTTDDPVKQSVIEKSDSFRRGWVKLVKVKNEDKELEMLAKSTNQSQTSPVLHPEDIKPDDDVLPDDDDLIIPAEPGATYSLPQLMAKKVAELKGICAQQGIKFEGLKKKELIQAILRG